MHLSSASPTKDLLTLADWGAKPSATVQKKTWQGGGLLHALNVAQVWSLTLVQFCYLFTIKDKNVFVFLCKHAIKVYVSWYPGTSSCLALRNLGTRVSLYISVLPEATHEARVQDGY